LVPAEITFALDGMGRSPHRNRAREAGRLGAAIADSTASSGSASLVDLLGCAGMRGAFCRDHQGDHMTTSTTPSTPSTKLSPNLVWLFALVAVAAGIGISYALAGLGQKVTAAVYFGVVAIGGFASTYTTRATIMRGVLAFLGIALVAAVAYYFLVDHIFSTATTTMSDAMSGGAAHAEGEKAGSALGHTFGMFVAIIVFLETSVAGVVGVVAGRKAATGGMASVARSGVRVRI
jgi:hypothetical protein